MRLQGSCWCLNQCHVDSHRHESWDSRTQCSSTRGKVFFPKGTVRPLFLKGRRGGGWSYCGVLLGWGGGGGGGSSWARKLGDILDKCLITFVDAPVSGGRKNAFHRMGTCRVMCLAGRQRITEKMKKDIGKTWICEFHTWFCRDWVCNQEAKRVGEEDYC